MMKRWAEILPLFFVKWWARRYCEVFHRNGVPFVSPRPGITIELKECAACDSGYGSHTHPYRGEVLR